MRIFIVLAILGYTVCCFGQRSKDKTKDESRNLEIKKSFPYNQTASVKLVSFKYNYSGIVQESDTVDIVTPIHQPEIPKTNGVVDIAKMFEIQQLDDQKKDRLFKILMNSDKDYGPCSVAFCYDPRNGILFYDSQDKLIGFIELCFQCSRYEKVPTYITISNFCDKHYDKLREVFKDAGITYGIIDSADK